MKIFKKYKETDRYDVYLGHSLINIELDDKYIVKDKHGNVVDCCIITVIEKKYDENFNILEKPIRYIENDLIIYDKDGNEYDIGLL